MTIIIRPKDATQNESSRHHSLKSGINTAIIIRPKDATQGESDGQVIATLETSAPHIGEHLITPRTGYTHHGIYVGNGKVIHYSGLANGLQAGAIEETTLDIFCNGQGFTMRPYRNPLFTGQVVVDRAHSRLGEDDYNLYSNNCEHFCEWCINDERRSKQVDDATDATTKGFAAFTVLRILAPPVVTIPLSIGYGIYCLVQKD